MSDRTLDELVSAARDYKMSPQERFDQRVSFVYGQMGGAWPKAKVRQYLIDRDGLPSTPAT